MPWPSRPVVADESYDGAADLLSFVVSKSVTFHGLYNTDPTPLAAGAIEAGADIVRPLAAGVNHIDWSDDLWGYGAFWLHCMVRDEDGNTQVLTPVAHTRVSPVFSEDWQTFSAGSLPRGAGQRYNYGPSGNTSAEITEAGDLRMYGITSSPRWVYDTLSAAALANRTSEVVQVYMRITNLAEEQTRGGIGYNQTLNKFYGLSIQYDTTASLTRYRALRGSDINQIGGGPVLLSVAAGTPVDVLMEIDGSEIRFKVWEVGQPEPEAWVAFENSDAGMAIAWPRLDFTTRVTSTNYLVHGWSLGIGSPAERLFS